MRIARILFKGQARWVKVEGEFFQLLRKAPYFGIDTVAEKIKIKSAKFLVPAEPSKIVLVGLNYRDHAKELGMKIPRNPIIFLKPLSALINHKDKIILPEKAGRVDYEAELALVIKKKAKNIPTAKAREHILGYTCLNDVTARQIQSRDGQWTRAKSFDSFCPVGPWLETGLCPEDLKIAAIKNNKIVQFSETSNFIFSVEELVSFISRVMTLFPGDIISTGTPAGVGPLKAGDKIEIAISGIGHLENTVGK